MVPGNCELEKDTEFSTEDESSVDREYREAFKTNSFTDLWNQVQTRMGQRRRSLRKSHTLSISLSFSSSTSSNYSLTNASSEYLLEPLQETQVDDIVPYKLHPLVINYLNATCKARDLCEVLLRNTRQIRANYRIIKRVIALADKVVGNGKTTEERFYNAMYKELSSLSNPMITINPMYFHNFNVGLRLLLCLLNTELRKSRKQAMLARYLMFCVQTDSVERRSVQIEVAAEGVYALVVAFGTISRLVRRLEDENEHNKAMADMCVRKGHRGILMEVVKEYRKNEDSFMEQLKELEDQTYLCFLNITRYRKQIVR